MTQTNIYIYINIIAPTEKVVIGHLNNKSNIHLLYKKIFDTIKLWFKVEMTNVKTIPNMKELKNIDKI